MNRFIEKLSGLLKGKRFLTAAVIMGAAGMLMILIPGSSGEKHRQAAENVSSFAGSEEYRAALEKRLEDMLSRIQGVGDVRVTITLGTSEEYIYATESNVNGERISTEYVIADKEGIVTRIDPPKITGAVIVCEGGGNTQVCEKICKAVSVALGIPSNRICVVKMR